jgi:hypothetical protein
MQHKIVIVSFLQILKKIDGFDLPKLSSAGESIIESLQHHYIMANDKGKIDAISGSLAAETGLHSVFFKSEDQISGSMSIEDLFNADMVNPDA